MQFHGSELFSGQRGDLHDYLSAKQLQLAAEVRGMSLPADLGADHVLADRLVSAYSVTPLSIDVEPPKIRVEPKPYVVSGRRTRYEVDGLEVIKSFAFSGDGALWFLRPNHFDDNPPHGSANALGLKIGFLIPESEHERIEAALEKIEIAVKSYIQRQAVQVAAYMTSLPSIAAEAIHKRRAQLELAANVGRRLSTGTS